MYVVLLKGAFNFSKDLYTNVPSSVFVGSIRGEVSGQMAIITRSNFTLFSQAVTKCCYSECSGRVAFVGVSKLCLQIHNSLIN